MEQSIQANTEKIIESFIEQLDSKVSEIKKTLTDDLISQLKSDFIEKINGFTDLEPVKQIDNFNFLHGCGHKTAYTIRNDICSRKDEYMINYKNQKHQLGYRFPNPIPTWYFSLAMTNYGSITMVSWYCDGNTCRDYRGGDKCVERRYIGKFKLPNIMMHIFSSVIDAILPYIPPIEGAGAYKYEFRDISEGEQVNKLCSTNVALRAGNGGVIMIRFLKIYENIMNVVSEYQEKHYMIPLSGYYAEQLIDENTKLKAYHVEVEKMKLEQDEIRTKINAEREEINKNMEKYKKIKDIEDRYVEIQKYKELLDTYAKKLQEDREQLEAEKLKLEKVKIESVITNIDFTKPFTEVWKSEQNNSESNSEIKVSDVKIKEDSIEDEGKDDDEADEEEDGINPKEIMPKSDYIKEAFSGLPLYYAVCDIVFGKSIHNSGESYVSDQEYRKRLKYGLADEIIETKNMGLFRAILELGKKSHKMSKFINKIFEITCREDRTGKYLKILLKDKRVDPAGKNNKPFYEAYSARNRKASELLLEDDRFNPIECFDVNYLRRAGSGLRMSGVIIRSLICHPKFDPTANDYNAIIKLIECLDSDDDLGEDDSGYSEKYKHHHMNELKLLRLLFADNRVKINDLRKALIKKNALHLFDVLQKYVDVKDTIEIVELDDIKQIVVSPKNINVRDIMPVYDNMRAQFNGNIKKNTGLSLYYSVYNIVCNEREYKSDTTQRVNKFSRSRCHMTKEEHVNWLLSVLAVEIVKVKNIELLQEILKIEGNSEKMSYFLRCMFQDACGDKGNTEIIKIMLNDKRVDPSHREISYFNGCVRSYDVEVAKLLLADKRFNPASNCHKMIIDLLHHVEYEIRHDKDEGEDDDDDKEDYSDHEDNICINEKEVLKLLITDRRVNINSLRNNLNGDNESLETLQKLINEFGIVPQ